MKRLGLRRRRELELACERLAAALIDRKAVGPVPKVEVTAHQPLEEALGDRIDFEGFLVAAQCIVGVPARAQRFRCDAKHPQEFRAQPLAGGERPRTRIAAKELAPVERECGRGERGKILDALRFEARLECAERAFECPGIDPHAASVERQAPLVPDYARLAQRLPQPVHVDLEIAVCAVTFGARPKLLG